MNTPAHSFPTTLADTSENDVIKAILSRHSVSPKRVVAPGPDTAQVLTLMSVAAAAPDHGKLRPWRFIDFPESSRVALADVFEAALLERLPDADAQARTRAREKASRAPTVLGLVLRLDHEIGIPHVDDQLVSGGAALQNVLLAAHTMGFGARALSGQAVRTTAFRDALNLADGEIFLCFIAIGTPISAPRRNARPAPESLITQWMG
ncbi:MAG: nitroreductase [Marinosulfonomonas sp.]|nr:nitroreductase [Marinosulfonomonas sp.]